MTPHSALKEKLKIELGQEPDFRFWNNPVGVAVGFDAKAGQVTHARYGLRKGSADLIGIQALHIEGMGVLGRFVSIELKCGRDKQSEEQLLWQGIMHTFGAAHIVARSVDDVRMELEHGRAMARMLAVRGAYLDVRTRGRAEAQ